MTRKTEPDKLVHVVTESANQIWSAGLGALSLAEKEGSVFFESLSKIGEAIQSHTFKTAKVARQTVTGSRSAATETWDKLEELFELRVGRALNALQIPTARDIKELTQRVEKLSQAVDQLHAESTRDTKAKTTTKKTTKTKTGQKVKKSVTKKPAAKGKKPATKGKKSVAKGKKKKSGAARAKKRSRA